MSRQRSVVIDFDEFEKLCQFQCTQTEIAAWFNTSTEILINRVKEHYGASFMEVYEEKKDSGRISLRRKQWQKAVDLGDNTMLIWLGKQYLNQTDGKIVTHTTDKEKSRLVIDFGDDPQNDSEANS